MLDYVGKGVVNQRPDPESAFLGVLGDNLSVQLVELNEVRPLQEKASEKLPARLLHAFLA